jgi:hypothetical protein
MMMGLRKAEEAIQCLQSNIQDPNVLASVLSRLMGEQDLVGSKLLMNAMYFIKSVVPTDAPLVSSREPHNFQSQSGSVDRTRSAQNVPPLPSSTRSDISSGSNVALGQLSHNPSHISNIHLVMMTKLSEEMKLLMKHLALVNSPVESYMYSALRKSILYDMICTFNAQYSKLLLSKPMNQELFKSRKEELLKLYQDVVLQYNALQLPNGFNLIPSSYRKSLETYITEYRQFTDRNVENINNYNIQGMNMPFSKNGLKENTNLPLMHPVGNLSQQQQKPVTQTDADHLSQIKQVEVSRSHPTSHLSVHLPNPATIPHHQSHGLSNIQESNNLHISRNPIVDVQKPIVEPAQSQPMVAAGNEQTKASTIILELPAPSVSNSSLAEKSKICNLQNNGSPKKKDKMAFDEAVGSGPMIDESLNDVNGDNRRIHLSKSKLSPDTLITVSSQVAVEESPPQVCGGVRAPSVVISSQCDVSQKKQAIIVIDDCVSERSDNVEELDTYQRKTLSSRKISTLTSPDRPLFKDRSISNDLLVNQAMIKSRKKVISDNTNDGSFISEIRSLNKASSPMNKKRKASESVDRIGTQHHQVDFNWQEGFVQGLFYNFGIESPFEQDQSIHVDQVYLDGFKAASSYYKRKVDEND